MFRPNALGLLQRNNGFDVYARPSYAPATPIKFGAINLATLTQPTTVRADSSASRGAADEEVSRTAKILVPRDVAIGAGDRFTFKGVSFVVIGVHERISVLGVHDHTEVNLAVLP